MDNINYKADRNELFADCWEFSDKKTADSEAFQKVFCPV